MSITLWNSPTIDALEVELRAGNRAALDAFWEEAERTGTPLVEEIPGETDVLVTFIYRGDDDTQSVGVFGGFPNYRYKDNLLSRLLDTDLWHLTCRAAPDLSALYQFMINGERTTDDPLNARYIEFPRHRHQEESGTPSISRSILELPAARPHTWAVPKFNAPRGQVVPHRFHSDILGNERTIWVYTPPGFRLDGMKYGLVVLHDGFVFANVLSAGVILTNLINAGELPPVVAIMPDQLDRSVELPCNPQWADFLALELLPWAQERFRATDDPEQTLIGGASYGALAAMYAALRYPERFGHVLSQSGSYWWSPDTLFDDPDVDQKTQFWMSEQFAGRERLPLKFYLDVGRMETGMRMQETNRHLRNTLRELGYPVAYQEFPGDHDLYCWRGTLVDGLLALMPKRT